MSGRAPTVPQLRWRYGYGEKTEGIAGSCSETIRYGMSKGASCGGTARALTSRAAGGPKKLYSAVRLIWRKRRAYSHGQFASDGGSREVLYWSEEDFRIWGFDPRQATDSRDAIAMHPSRGSPQGTGIRPEGRRREKRVCRRVQNRAARRDSETHPGRRAIPSSMW